MRLRSFLVAFFIKLEQNVMDAVWCSWSSWRFFCHTLAFQQVFRTHWVRFKTRSGFNITIHLHVLIQSVCTCLHASLLTSISRLITGFNENLNVSGTWTLKALIGPLVRSPYLSSAGVLNHIHLHSLFGSDLHKQSGFQTSCLLEGEQTYRERIM